MPNLARRALLAVAAGLLIPLAVACGAESGGEGGASDKPSGGKPTSHVMAPGEVLLASADSFAQEVQSLRAELEFSVAMGDLNVEAIAEMAFQAPDKLHMNMDVGGLGSFEMLMLGSDIYMNIPPEGWVVMSLEDLGVDAQAFRELIESGSPVDYEQIISQLGGGIQQLPDETIDGKTYRHYTANLEFADLLGAFSDAFSVAETLPVDGVSGPLTFDVWVDAKTLLPDRFDVSGTLGLGEQQSAEFTAAMRFLEYNGPVEIPGPPTDAQPFTLQP